MEKKKKRSTSEPGASRREGRDEMNLCELPFATLSERSNGREVLHFEIEDYDPELDQKVQRALTVRADPEHGLPTEKDEEIYLGLLKYSHDYNGLSDPTIRFCRAALFELMGWPKSDWAYARLTKGMHRLVGVRLTYQNLWRDNCQKQWRDQGAFGILDSFRFRDSRTVGASASYTEQYSVFRWGSVLFQSFDSNYLKRIDYDLVQQVSVTARRLYRYLDKHFYAPHKTRITMDVAKLAYQHLGVSQGIEPDKVRNRYLEPAATELERLGFLAPSSQGRFRKLRRGVWEVTFDLASKQAPSRSVSVKPKSGTVEFLSRRGISPTTAVTLTATYRPAQIQAAVALLEQQHRNGNTIRDRDAWLSAALKNGYQAPEAQLAGAQRPERQRFRSQRHQAEILR